MLVMKLYVTWIDFVRRVRTWDQAFMNLPDSTGPVGNFLSTVM